MDAENTIFITPQWQIAMDDVSFVCCRADGPGGQGVNRTDSAVQLRWQCPVEHLPPAVMERLRHLAGSRLGKEGLLTMEARESRSQHRNRELVLEHFTALLKEAARLPKVRRKTRPTLASREKRLEQKRRHSEVKGGRRKGNWE
jgi:ribosome-associated protein